MEAAAKYIPPGHGVIRTALALRRHGCRSAQRDRRAGKQRLRASPQRGGLTAYEICASRQAPLVFILYGRHHRRRARLRQDAGRQPVAGALDKTALSGAVKGRSTSAGVRRRLAGEHCHSSGRKSSGKFEFHRGSRGDGLGRGAVRHQNRPDIENLPVEGEFGESRRHAVSRRHQKRLHLVAENHDRLEGVRVTRLLADPPLFCQSKTQ